MSKEIIVAILLGIGLSASSGFRIFIPLLVASIASYFKVLPLGAAFEWMGSWPAMISFGTASIVEIIAYYIPVVDNLLDTITTPLALVAGTLLTTSVLPLDNELMKWILGIIVGGGSAGIVQSGTAMTRLLSTKTTLATANPVVATGENIGAVGGSILSLFFPIFIGIIFLLFIIFLIGKMLKRFQFFGSKNN